MIGKGAPDCVTTLVERKTGYALIGKLSDRTMFSTSQRTKMLLRRVPDQVKTITADNGTEFHDYESAASVRMEPDGARELHWTKMR